MTPQQLKNSILQLAITGKLLSEEEKKALPQESVQDLIAQIKAEKEKLIKEGKIKKSKPLPAITEEEKPFDIPENWEWVTLGYISTFNEPKKKTKLSESSPNLWCLELEDIEKGGKLLSKKMVKEKTSIGDKTIFNKDDILYSKLRPYLLKILIADDDGICTSEIIPFKLFGRISSKYILMYLKTNYVNHFINTLTYGVKMPRVNTNTMTNLLVPLPSLQEQQAIVEKLDKILPFIELYAEKYHQLNVLDGNIAEQLKKSLLQQAITGNLLTDKEREKYKTESASQLLAEIKQEKEKLIKEGKIKKSKALPAITEEEKPFDIPENWVWVKFNEVVYFIMGKTPPRKEFIYWEKPTINWISIADINDGKILSNTKEKVNEHALNTIFKNRISKKDTLIMSFKLTVGKVSILGCDAVHNEAIISIYPFIDENFIFRNYLFKFLPFLSKLGDTKKAIKGNTLNSDSLNNLLIPLPPLKEQQAIVEKLEKLLAKIEQLKALTAHKLPKKKRGRG